mgnify:FL=1
MVIYMYLAILIVTSILTGIIVTIIERKGFYPKPVKVEKKKKIKKKKEKKYPDPVITSAVTIMNMAPIAMEEVQAPVDNYDIPVLLSSYTVDLGDVVQEIKKQENGIDRVQESKKNQTEGLV